MPPLHAAGREGTGWRGERIEEERKGKRGYRDKVPYLRYYGGILVPGRAEEPSEGVVSVDSLVGWVRSDAKNV